MQRILFLVALAATFIFSCGSDPKVEPPGGFGAGGVPSSGGFGAGGSGGYDGTPPITLGGDFNPGGGNTGGEPPACVDVEVDFEPEVPTVITLIDQSGSMIQDLAGETRWNAVRDTLIGTNGIIPALEDSVQFGLMLYTGPDQGNGSVCPLITEVAPAVSNLGAITTQYQPDDWLWETPTGDSVAAAASSLASYPEPKVIILATDGEPDTCELPNPQRGQQEAKDAVAAAYGQGITTYVLSVGDDVSDTHLREVANLGQGYPEGDTTDRFYRSNSQAELLSAFQEIIDGERSCKLTLDGEVKLGSEEKGTVTLDGEVLTYKEDWRLNTPSELELVGEACNTVLSGGHDLDIVFPCEEIVIIPR